MGDFFHFFINLKLFDVKNLSICRWFYSRRFLKFFFLVLSLLVLSCHGQKSSQSEISLNETEKTSLLQYGRLVLENQNDEAQNFVFSQNIIGLKIPLILTIFSQDGDLIVTRRIDDVRTSLAEKIKTGLMDLRTGYVLEPDKVYLHVMLVTDTARFANFGPIGLFDYKVYEPLVTGIAYEKAGKRVELNPLEALVHGFNTQRARFYLAEKMGLDDYDTPSDNDLTIEIYRVLHFGEAYPGRETKTYFRGHEVFSTSDLSEDVLLNRLQLVGTWYEHNVIDHEVTYFYYPRKGTYNNHSRTIIRSAMAVWVLNKLAFFLNDEKLKTLGDDSFSFTWNLMCICLSRSRPENFCRALNLLRVAIRCKTVIRQRVF